MCKKIYRGWNVFYLTISPVTFFLEKDTIPDVVKCGVADEYCERLLAASGARHSPCGASRTASRVLANVVDVHLVQRFANFCCRLKAFFQLNGGTLRHNGVDFTGKDW